MARDVERIELLFRRQLALEPAEAPDRRVISRLDPVPARRDPAGWPEIPVAISIGRVKAAPDLPKSSLTASAGFYNAARVPNEAAAWLIIVEQNGRKDIKELISTVCQIQSSTRAFRPIFVLDETDDIELMRQYGFTFEFICPESYMGTSRAQQIELLKKKWGAEISVELRDVPAESFHATGEVSNPV